MYLEKYHALGNDFLVVERSDFCDGKNFGELAKRLCSRKKCLGADGLIVVDKKTCQVDFFNADGSFEYKVIYNNVINSAYAGTYRLSDDGITILSVETTMRIPLPDISDFDFALGKNIFVANVIIAEEDSLIFLPCELTKTSGGVDDDLKFDLV